METVTLVKDYKKRQFSPKAAKIAVEHFGWSELTAPAKPSEVGTKTRPPIIDKPIVLKPIQSELKDYPIEKKAESVEIKAAEIVPTEIKATEVEAEPVKEKKSRKSPVKSKSKSK